MASEGQMHSMRIGHDAQARDTLSQGSLTAVNVQRAEHLEERYTALVARERRAAPLVIRAHFHSWGLRPSIGLSISEVST